jgi:hypothetical protein
MPTLILIPKDIFLLSPKDAPHPLMNILMKLSFLTLPIISTVAEYFLFLRQQSNHLLYYHF